jgi:hypothetical protein
VLSKKKKKEGGIYTKKHLKPYLDRGIRMKRIAM